MTIRNTGDESVAISDLMIVGSQAITFKLSNLPPLPLLLRPSLSVTVSVGFAPPADAEPGVHRARLRIVRSGDDDGPPCDMSALVTKGTDLASEPPVQQILDTLGYAPEKALATLRGLGYGQPRAVRAIPECQARQRGPVRGRALLAGRVFPRTAPIPRKTGSFVDQAHGQHRQGTQPRRSTPSWKVKGRPVSTQATRAFGILRQSCPSARCTRKTNATATAPSTRCASTPCVAEAARRFQTYLLVVVDEDGDGDFQDYVFTLVNVKPAHLENGLGRAAH